MQTKEARVNPDNKHTSAVQQTYSFGDRTVAAHSMREAVEKYNAMKKKEAETPETETPNDI